MLEITLPEIEYFDEGTETFSTSPGAVLTFEHSLVSVSKWESKYQKPFLSSDAKTYEEIKFYIWCMLLGNSYDISIIDEIDHDNIDKIQAYIDSPQTATTFYEEPATLKGTGSSEIITSELIYYWMVTFGISFDCETWNLKRLLVLIKVCALKNTKEESMSSSEIARRNHELNERRKRELGTTG